MEQSGKHSGQATLEATIIPPEQHPITEDLIDQDALFVLRKLNNSGYASYLVGGGVRDLYLGKDPKDFDICTDARPGQIRKLFPNSRTIGRRFRLVQIFFKHGKIIEVATLRSLSEHDLDGPEAILAPNNTFGSLDQDAQRRDLTINSLFYEIEQHTIIDYIGGVDDLDKSLVKFVGDPGKRIHRDPVRMLRAVRHSARNNFLIEDESWKGICDNYHLLTLCPPSRLRDELLKDLYGGFSEKWLTLAVESSLFFELFSIYSKDLFFKEKKSDNCLSQLKNILGVVDRTNHYLVNSSRSRPNDFFLLALIIIPWALEKHNLTDIPIKGSERFHVSQKIRTDIDSFMGQQLNLRKSTRQEMTTLLINLPLFIHHNEKGSWPKWLKRKSYYKKCSLFFHFFQEAYNNIQIPDSILEAKTYKKDKSGPVKRRRGGNKQTKKNNSASSSRRGNVFGLKKR